jgi:hypothetical protein
MPVTVTLQESIYYVSVGCETGILESWYIHFSNGGYWMLIDWFYWCITQAMPHKAIQVENQSDFRSHHVEELDTPELLHMLSLKVWDSEYTLYSK